LSELGLAAFNLSLLLVELLEIALVRLGCGRHPLDVCLQPFDGSDGRPKKDRGVRQNA
jgi:hypothetical protein